MGETWSFIVTGLVVGVLSGLIGIGGAVVLVPVLVLWFGFSQGRAQGTTIGALVPPIGLLAALQYYRNGMLDVRVAALIGLGFVFGALGGASLVPYISQIWLKRIFASVLIYMAAQLVFADPKRKSAGVGIVTGPFAGKVGTIAEMEGTKSARVLLGLLSTRLDLSNLTLLDATGAAAKAPPEATLPKAP